MPESDVLVPGMSISMKENLENFRKVRLGTAAGMEWAVGYQYANVNGRTIRLIDDAILIRLEKPERFSARHRLWIPDTAKREDWEVYHGIVIAAGPGRRDKRGKLLPMEVTPGEHVQFYWLAGETDVTEMFADGQEYRIISEKSVMAVIHD